MFIVIVSGLLVDILKAIVYDLVEHLIDLVIVTCQYLLETVFIRILLNLFEQLNVKTAHIITLGDILYHIIEIGQLLDGITEVVRR